MLRRRFVWPILLLCVSALSCRGTRVTRPYHEPPPSDIQPTIVEYIEKDAFDAFFESALTNQDPVILIQTDTTRPDWGPRLNAWIAAWIRGGKVVDDPPTRARMQAPLSPVTINGETLREFRLLIDDVMKHVEDAAQRGSSWWKEERTQRRRIALLKPYSLRFHLDEDKNIQLIFFNGKYSQYYRRFMDSIASEEADETDEWCREVKCSRCKEKMAASTAQRTHIRLNAP